MKKLFTLMAVALASLSAMAADYTDTLEVTVNGTSTSQPATISVDKQDNGLYNLKLKNFTLSSGGSEMPVGTINLKDVKGADAAGVTTLSYADNIQIENGDDASKSWLGPMLGDVPVDMKAEIRGEKLYTVININMTSLKQVIQVVFGNGGYQIGNSGFENFHKATYWSFEDPEEGEERNKAEGYEPNNWHSFLNSSSYMDDGTSQPVWGWMAAATGDPHTHISDVVRPGSTGTKSVLITSTEVWGVIANGTITTGRINAASMTATDPLNHSWSCMDSTAVDDNGDPFYTALNGLPDSITVWVKFKQETPQADHPYATVNAVITDGTYYQDPEDKPYTNVIAKATDAKIASNDFVWQRLSIPFNYVDGVSAEKLNGRKALHVTISTNADAGCGSTDSLYVDDIALVYNAGLKSVTIKGQQVALAEGQTVYDVEGIKGAIEASDVAAVADGRGAKVATAVARADDGTTVTVTVTSNDYKTTRVYTFNVKEGTNGIASHTVNNSAAAAVYNINGQRVDNAAHGNVYIIRQADGRVVKKVIK